MSIFSNNDYIKLHHIDGVIEQPKLCINCKWVATSYHDEENAKCMAPKNNNGISLVTGKPKYFNILAKDVRNSTNQYDCCDVGRWFEPKEITQPEYNNAPTGESSKLQEIRAKAKLRTGKLTNDDLENL